MENSKRLGVLNHVAAPYDTLGVLPRTFQSSTMQGEDKAETPPHKAGKTKLKKRTWKKPKDKPKRPLSAYNLFFQAEREKIVKNSMLSVPPGKILEKRTRRHRRSHGKIGFANLARSIAEKWKALEDVEKTPFAEQASVEKRRYRIELDAWNKAREAKETSEEDRPQAGKDDSAATTTKRRKAPVPTSHGSTERPTQSTGRQMCVSDTLAILQQSVVLSARPPVSCQTVEPVTSASGLIQVEPHRPCSFAMPVPAPALSNPLLFYKPAVPTRVGSSVGESDFDRSIDEVLGSFNGFDASDSDATELYSDDINVNVLGQDLVGFLDTIG